MQSGFLIIYDCESEETIRSHVLLELESKILCFSSFRKYVTSVPSSLVIQNTILIAAEIIKRKKVCQLKLCNTNADQSVMVKE